MAAYRSETTSYPVESVIDGLSEAGVRSVTLEHRDYCTLMPGDLYPFGYAANPDRTVRQQLCSVVRLPGEADVIGLVTAQTLDRIGTVRHAGVLVTRLAIEGNAEQPAVQSVLRPDKILRAESPPDRNGNIDWATGVAVGGSYQDMIVMHRGSGTVRVHVAPQEFAEPALLSPDLWAPDAETAAAALETTQW